ncbi:ATP synthase subunit I [Rhodoferax sp.]|uniref:ATP synthase subunit I n=1 Tax=Rhodoferax sp. TaxID=50421 RepID=UPI002636AF37|nr:ATP synthase subunit I [Rhodoferax sp.]MDD2919804.1 ATP synthase subunit I [Rhodoferax sp.]
MPLTRSQAQALAAAHPAVSLWWVVLGQVAVGGLTTLVAWLVFGDGVAKSVACGAFAVVLPAALFARGLTSRFARANPGMAVMSFFVWELVKIVMTIGVLFASHRLVEDLNWPAMLVGLVLTLKVYWLALAFKRKAKPVR